ncbi:hypothetical protein EMCRGX_G009475 [Ephydatia muelleri]
MSDADVERALEVLDSILRQARDLTGDAQVLPIQVVVDIMNSPLFCAMTKARCHHHHTNDLYVGGAAGPHPRASPPGHTAVSAIETTKTVATDHGAMGEGQVSAGKPLPSARSDPLLGGGASLARPWKEGGGGGTTLREGRPVGQQLPNRQLPFSGFLDEELLPAKLPPKPPTRISSPPPPPPPPASLPQSSCRLVPSAPIPKAPVPRPLLGGRDSRPPQMCSANKCVRVKEGKHAGGQASSCAVEHEILPKGGVGVAPDDVTIGGVGFAPDNVTIGRVGVAPDDVTIGGPVGDKSIGGEAQTELQTKVSHEEETWPLTKDVAKKVEPVTKWAEPFSKGDPSRDALGHLADVASSVVLRPSFDEGRSLQATRSTPLTGSLLVAARRDAALPGSYPPLVGDPPLRHEGPVNAQLVSSADTGQQDDGSSSPSSLPLQAANGTDPSSSRADSNLRSSPVDGCDPLMPADPDGPSLLVNGGDPWSPIRGNDLPLPANPESPLLPADLRDPWSPVSGGIGSSGSLGLLSSPPIDDGCSSLPRGDPSLAVSHREAQEEIDVASSEMPFSWRDTNNHSKIKTSLGNRSERVVMLLKTTSDLGLELVGRSSTGVFVKDTAPGSPAHQVGGLVAGDQIVEVNALSNMASFEVKELMKGAPLHEEVALEVKYNPTGLCEYMRKKC